MLKSDISLLGNVKDQALSLAMRELVNHQIKEYGFMVSFKLDSKENTIDLELMLGGEVEPLQVRVGRYEMLEEVGGNRIRIHDIRAS